MEQTKKILRRVGLPIAATVFWIAVWQIAAMFVARAVVLPYPLDVLCRFWELAKTSIFWRAVGHSLFRIMIGYTAALVCGILLGGLMHFVRPTSALLSPLLTVIRATPVASFILVAYVVLRHADIPTVISFLMVLPMIAVTVRSALSETDKSLLEMAVIYRFSFGKTLRTVYFPALRTPLRAQALAAIGYAWKAGIAAEVLCTPRESIGKYLYESKVYLETVDLFAYTLVVILISLALEAILHRLLPRVKGGKVA